MSTLCVLGLVWIVLGFVWQRIEVLLVAWYLRNYREYYQRLGRTEQQAESATATVFSQQQTSAACSQDEVRTDCESGFEDTCNSQVVFGLHPILRKLEKQLAYHPADERFYLRKDV